MGRLFKQVKAPVVSNALASTVAMLVRGNTTEVKEAQLANADAPTEVTAAGIEIERRPLLANADWPIDVTELDKLIDVKALQPSKA